MTAPLVLGVLYDFPQGDGGALFEAALHEGLSETAARRTRPVTLRSLEVHGLPAGSAGEVEAGLRHLADDGVCAVVGPSISDNAIVAAPVADALGLACINYSGGERTRSEWMFHYQVGSLEEEPLLLAERMVERGLERAAVVFDDSVVGRRYEECFRHACARHACTLVESRSVTSLATEVTSELDALRAHAPDVLVYLGLGVSARAVAVGLVEVAWSVPVLANSALMFGYARRDWRLGFAGWEYIDTVADDNSVRDAFARRLPRAASGPIGCAAYDIGRLLGEALVRAPDGERRAVHDALEAVKGLPAASGHDGTVVGFGAWDRGALHGRFLVLREWHDGHSRQVVRPR
ncbi:MAG TPA: ABC transporter substrate-binding protein [Acidimicrobiia bacterium]|nr:ABC transporter substrate-binding protein [Acidimicrobiia bacterium]